MAVIPQPKRKIILFEALKTQIESLEQVPIGEDRRRLLDPIREYVNARAQKDLALNFICTHNSRRSHLSQTWAQALAHHFTFENVRCFSGGTEATAVYPSVLKAFEHAGFKVKHGTETNNPTHAILFAIDKEPVLAFSKTISDSSNPTSGFAAIMTCSQADQDCPLVLGAEQRFSLPYEDPKVSDGTPNELGAYIERSNQIARELMYVFGGS